MTEILKELRSPGQSATAAVTSLNPARPVIKKSTLMQSNSNANLKVVFLRPHCSATRTKISSPSVQFLLLKPWNQLPSTTVKKQ